MTSDVEIEDFSIPAALRHYWWIVLGVPLVAFVASLVLLRFDPYQAEIRATVLIPGDTEDPGNSERPELMVLDDLPGFIRSFAFAQSVHEELGESEIGIEEVEGALDASRYSRILTVTISSNDAELVEAIAPAVEVVLADQINTFLIPEGGVPATVNIIDPAKAPEQDRTDMLFEILLVTSMGLLIGSLVAIGLASRDEDIQAA